MYAMFEVSGGKEYSFINFFTNWFKTISLKQLDSNDEAEIWFVQQEKNFKKCIRSHDTNIILATNEHS